MSADALYKSNSLSILVGELGYERKLLIDNALRYPSVIAAVALKEEETDSKEGLSM